jgi:hypothetical protein
VFGSDGNSKQNKVCHIQGGVFWLAVLEMPFTGMSVVVLFCHGAIKWTCSLVCQLLELPLKAFDGGVLTCTVVLGTEVMLPFACHEGI